MQTQQNVLMVECGSLGGDPVKHNPGGPGPWVPCNWSDSHLYCSVYDTGLGDDLSPRESAHSPVKTGAKHRQIVGRATGF